MILDQVAKEVPEDEEMEDGEIRPSPVAPNTPSASGSQPYVRPHTPRPVEEWDNSVTEMLVSILTQSDSQSCIDRQTD